MFSVYTENVFLLCIASSIQIAKSNTIHIEICLWNFFYSSLVVNVCEVLRGPCLEIFELGVFVVSVVMGY